MFHTALKKQICRNRWCTSHPRGLEQHQHTHHFFSFHPLYSVPHCSYANITLGLIHSIMLSPPSHPYSYNQKICNSSYLISQSIHQPQTTSPVESFPSFTTAKIVKLRCSNLYGKFWTQNLPPFPNVRREKQEVLYFCLPHYSLMLFPCCKCH